jgi:hypothetical protein
VWEQVEVGQHIRKLAVVFSELSISCMQPLAASLHANDITLAAALQGGQNDVSVQRLQHQPPQLGSVLQQSSGSNCTIIVQKPTHPAKKGGKSPTAG